MKKLRLRFKTWNNWRKRSANNWFYKLLVLLGLVQSPSFHMYFRVTRIEDALEKLGESILTMEVQANNELSQHN